MTENNIYIPLQNHLVTYLKISVKDATIRDFSKSFKWLNKKKLFCVFHNVTKDAYLLLEEESGKWIQLNKKENKDQFFILMKPLTDSLNLSSPRELRYFTKTIFQLYQDPRAELIDDLFLERNEKVLYSYMREGNNNQELLKSYCKKIYYEKKGEYWQLNFNVMNKDGGLQKWNVFIKDVIFSISISDLEKDQTFYFPNEY